ncbi:hypothetical protein [Anaerosphaera multitolerans]|nr:hypothetical protein [Anaerosphaera multitolerans]
MSKGGNHNQKNNPVNSMEYMYGHSVKSIFIFILSHPDMNHMDGIEDLFNEFKIVNFWDTENKKVIDDNSEYH